MATIKQKNRNFISGFNIIEDESAPKDKVFFIPTNLNLVLSGGDLQVIENGRARDLTPDEQKQFAMIANLNTDGDN